MATVVGEWFKKAISEEREGDEDGPIGRGELGIVKELEPDLACVKKAKTCIN